MLAFDFTCHEAMTRSKAFELLPKPSQRHDRIGTLGTLYSLRVDPISVAASYETCACSFVVVEAAESEVEILGVSLEIRH